MRSPLLIPGTHMDTKLKSGWLSAPFCSPFLIAHNKTSHSRNSKLRVGLLSIGKEASNEGSLSNEAFSFTAAGGLF